MENELLIYVYIHPKCTFGDIFRQFISKHNPGYIDRTVAKAIEEGWILRNNSLEHIMSPRMEKFLHDWLKANLAPDIKIGFKR